MKAQKTITNSIFVFFLLGFLLPIFQAYSAGEIIFDNGKRRFGNGGHASATYTVSESSIDPTTGNFRQPFYYDSGASLWYKLTYSTYSLNNAVAIDGDGSNLWNLNGSILQDNAYNPTIDTTGFIFNSGSTVTGYGDIVTTGTMTIGGKTLLIKNTYTLGQNTAYTRIVTKVTNTSATGVTNLRYWVGTQDDWVGVSDSPDKTKGKIQSGTLVPISSTSENAPALKIESAGTAVLFLTTYDPARVNMHVKACCSFANAYGTDPTSSSIVTNGTDGSYALFVRLDDLAPGASDEFAWYYAAGPSSIINDIISEVIAGAAADAVTPAVTSPTEGQLVNTNPLPIIGTGTVGDTISIYDGLGLLLTTGTVNGSGIYSITPPSFLQGSNTIRVTARTGTGTESGPTVRIFIMDSVAPSVPTVGSFGGDSTDPYITNDTTPSAVLSAESGSTVTIPGWTCLPTPVSSTGSVVCTANSPLSEGSGSVTPSISDAAGNSISGSLLTFTIDTTPPSAPTATTPTSTGSWNPTTTPITGSGTPGDIITITDGSGTVIGTGTVNGSGSYSILTTATPSTPNPVTITECDAANNCTPIASSITPVVDVTAPSAPLVETVGGNAPSAATSDTTPTITGNGEPGSTVTMRDGLGNVIGTSIINGSGSWVITPTVTLAGGSTMVSFSTTDLAGNTSGVTSLVVLIQSTGGGGGGGGGGGSSAGSSSSSSNPSSTNSPKYESSNKTLNSPSSNSKDGSSTPSENNSKTQEQTYVAPPSSTSTLDGQNNNIRYVGTIKDTKYPVYEIKNPLTDYICPKVVKIYDENNVLAKDINKTKFIEDINALIMFRGLEQNEEENGQTFKEQVKSGIATNDTDFEPTRNVTRAEFIKMIVRALSCRYTFLGTDSGFNDVDKDMWYAAYITFAVKNDWISGYDDGTFRPNTFITRAEAAKILARAIKIAFNTNVQTTFVDVDEEEGFTPYIEALRESDIFQGTSKKTFDPDRYIPRTEVARIIYRTFLGGVTD